VTSPVDVLVVGAGPTGLALALQAHCHGARVRVVERRPDRFRPSRALIVHPRTLEVLRPLGVVGALLAKADTSPAVHLHLGSRLVPVRLADLALSDTAFPHLSLLRQADVEAVLGDALAGHGIRVERGTELVDVRHGAAGSRSAWATLRSGAGTEELACGAVAGCDGAASTVRARAGIGWPGRPYRQEVVLADVELDGDLEPEIAHAVAGRRGLLFVFAIGERATWRLLATRPAGDRALPFGESGPPVPVDELQRLLDDADLAARITDVGWSTRVRLQHRLASRYRHGPLFLAGDAAHTHSPAAGQGMNTGIQDAVNLGWKLAFAPQSMSPDDLLDTYQQERRPVARQVLILTHLAFWAESSTDPVASFLRGALAPLGAPAVPLVLGRRRLVAQGVRVLSQLRVNYRGSPISVNGSPPRRGEPRAGDRLPDATVTSSGRQVRLHELTAGPGVHILLQRDAPEPAPEAHGPHVHIHRLAGTPGSGLLVVRPDGYIGLRSDPAGTDWLDGWLRRIGATTGILRPTE
jgi:2-polyprenyl-6-methoxyphenol hydroxylase-like FAD-dependent oxidoreductase